MQPSIGNPVSWMGKGNWEILFNVTLLNFWLGVEATFKVSSQQTNDQERYFGAAEAVFNNMLSRTNPYLAVGRGFLTPPPRFFHISYLYRFLNLISLKKEEIKKLIEICLLRKVEYFLLTFFLRFRVIHKGWDFRDDCMIQLVSLYSWFQTGLWTSASSFANSFIKPSNYKFIRKDRNNYKIVIF